MATTMTSTAAAVPEVRAIGIADIDAALHRGWQDFRAAPLYGLLFSAVYVGAGILLWVYLTDTNRVWWIVPFAAGFPLIAPFAAVGLYEVSRRLEQGVPLRFGEIAGVVWRQRTGQMPYMALMLFFAFMGWILMAYGIFAAAFGPSALTMVSRSLAFLDSGPGVAMMAVGAIAGGLLAAAIFAVSVVSLPLLLDREVDVVTAMATSLAAVRANPRAMGAWAVLVAGLLAIGMLPAFLGLFLILPVLGHASWHVYRKAVV